MRIIVAEDDPAMLQFLKEAIQEMGHEVIACENGAKAWEEFKADPTPLVLIDWVMPGITGIDLTRLIREHRSGSRTVILMSASAEEENKLSIALEAGINDYIHRPISIDSLKLRIAICEQHVKNLTTLRKAYKKLQNRDHKANYIYRLNEQLMGCETRAEAVQVFEFYLPNILPGTSGGLAMTANSSESLQTAFTWGEKGSKLAPGFDLRDCWSLRKGNTYGGIEDEVVVPCSHYTSDEVGDTLCHPLIVYGKTYGIVWVEFPPKIEDRDADVAHVTMVSDTFKLALSGIELREALTAQATTDSLTGLYNRRFTRTHLERELARSKRYNSSFCVAMIDLDHFKRLNDTYGHDAGDQALRELARLLKTSMRETDVACRWGGEEFLVVLSDTDIEGARTAMDSFRQRWQEHVLIFGETVMDHSTLSAGIAECGGDCGGIDALLNRADQALYTAKESGRNQVQCAE